MTLLVQPSIPMASLKVIVIDRGPSKYDWIKVVLPNGEECFAYPDTDKTIPAKMLDIGTAIYAEAPRECKKEGRTKWTTNLCHTMFQPQHIQDYVKSLLDDSNVDEFSYPDKSLKKSKKSNVSVPYSLSRYEFIEKVVQEKHFDGKYARSNATAYIIDTCIASGLL